VSQSKIRRHHLSAFAARFETQIERKMSSCCLEKKYNIIYIYIIYFFILLTKVTLPCVASLQTRHTNKKRDFERLEGDEALHL